jgi:hypothetical protein
MQWGKWILDYLFDCVHPHTTWPHRDRTGLGYVCCLDCGKELPYSTRRMSVVSPEERLEDRDIETWGRNPRVPSDTIVQLFRPLGYGSIAAADWGSDSNPNEQLLIEEQATTSIAALEKSINTAKAYSATNAA